VGYRETLPGSRYGDADDVVPGKASSYRWRFQASAATGTLRPVYEKFPALLRGSGGINSTTVDMAKWAAALLDGKLLDRYTRDRMWAPVRFADNSPGQWGLGWEIHDRGGHRMVGMTGAGRSAIFLYPDDDIAVVVLTNLAGAYPEDFIDSVAKLYAPGLPLGGVPALRTALEATDFVNPAETLNRIKKEPGAALPEAELNDWGYRLLGAGRQREALAVLNMIAELYPLSGNAWDSLGEAQAANGNRDSALASYRKAIELNPKNENAKMQIAKLQR
jgi:CubicO group peptidase (beta-lactamase class C family)